MISLIIFSIVSFLGAWAWLAYEFKHSAHLSIEDETKLDEQLLLGSCSHMEE